MDAEVPKVELRAKAEAALSEGLDLTEEDITMDPVLVRGIKTKVKVRALNLRYGVDGGNDSPLGRSLRDPIDLAAAADEVAIQMLATESELDPWRVRRALESVRLQAVTSRRQAIEVVMPVMAQGLRLRALAAGVSSDEALTAAAAQSEAVLPRRPDLRAAGRQAMANWLNAEAGSQPAVRHEAARLNVAAGLADTLAAAAAHRLQEHDDVAGALVEFRKAHEVGNVKTRLFGRIISPWSHVWEAMEIVREHDPSTPDRTAELEAEATRLSTLPVSRETANSAARNLMAIWEDLAALAPKGTPCPGIDGVSTAGPSSPRSLG